MRQEPKFPPRVWRALAAALCPLVLLLSGCGGGRATVEGSVTHRASGKKVIWGNVVIFGSDNVRTPV